MPWLACLAETAGTFIIVFLGTGVIHAAVLTGAQADLWQIAVVWGLAVTLTIYATAAYSGAHLNPAVTAAYAVWRAFPARKVFPYIMAQLLGAFLAAAGLHALFGGILADFEKTHGLTRGQGGSELPAMVYGEYFPNPGLGALSKTHACVSKLQAMLAEGLGTLFLVFMIFTLTDKRNAKRPMDRLAPPFIGLAVAAAISVIGPRLFAWLAGWGQIAIPGPRGGFFTVYILAPMLGGLAGASLHEWFARLALVRSVTGVSVPHRRSKENSSISTPAA